MQMNPHRIQQLCALCTFTSESLSQLNSRQTKCFLLFTVTKSVSQTTKHTLPSSTNASAYFFAVFAREMDDGPVENVHELVFTVGHAELHDSVQQVHQVRREITVKRRYGAFKVVTASHRINLRQQNLQVCALQSPLEVLDIAGRSWQH